MIKTFEKYTRRNTIRTDLIDKITSLFERLSVNGELKFDQPILRDYFEGVNGACIEMNYSGEHDLIFLKFDEFTKSWPEDEDEFDLFSFKTDELSILLKTLKDMYPEVEEAEKFNM